MFASIYGSRLNNLWYRNIYPFLLLNNLRSFDFKKMRKQASVILFFTIYKSMILHNQKEECDRLFFKGRVEVHYTKSLTILRDYTFKTSILFYTKYARFNIRFHDQIHLLQINKLCNIYNQLIIFRLLSLSRVNHSNFQFLLW